MGIETPIYTRLAERKHVCSHCGKPIIKGEVVADSARLRGDTHYPACTIADYKRWGDYYHAKAKETEEYEKNRQEKGN